MKKVMLALAILLPFLLVVGCIVSDQLTTFTIHPDGSADVVIFRANLRSSEKGERAESELADYKTRFDTRTDDEFIRIRDAGGTIDASWVREQAPFSNVIRARFADATALEKYLTMRNDDGGPLVTTSFHKDGQRRKLTILVTMPTDQIPASESFPNNVEQSRQSYADGISETRFAVTRGAITAARGFNIAEDKQSALLDISALAAMLRRGQGKADLHLEWEVTQ